VCAIYATSSVPSAMLFLRLSAPVTSAPLRPCYSTSMSAPMIPQEHRRRSWSLPAKVCCRSPFDTRRESCMREPGLAKDPCAGIFPQFSAEYATLILGVVSGCRCEQDTLK